MLKIIINENNNKLLANIVNDVEKEFKQIQIFGSDLDKILIEKIEKGTYLDKNSFIDRFGYKQYLNNISTGCKAALCVANIPEKIINLVECGNNARDAIISLIKDGNILIENNSITISNEFGSSIDVIIDNKRFKDLDMLNRYIFSERELNKCLK